MPFARSAGLSFRPAPLLTRQTSRLKLCFISETLHAGVGRHIVDVVSELSRRGHEIHLLYSPIRTDARFLADLMVLPNVHCHAVPMRRAIGAGDIAAFRAIKNYVRTNGPFELIHGYSSKGGGYARLLKLFGYGGPVLYSPQAFVTLSPVAHPAKRAMYRTLEGVLAGLTDRIVCASRAELEHAQTLGIAGNRLALVANGSARTSAPCRDAIRTQLGLSPDQVVVGFVGRMEDQKAPERLVAAAHLLLPRLPELKLLMVGDGPKRQVLEEGLARAGLGDRAIWLGAADGRHYMPAMDVFVLPSLYEGFAYVLIEALHAGLPIVSTPVGGAHESIRPGVNGMIVPHDSLDAMVTAIEALAIGPGLRRRMGESSRGWAEHFSIPRMVDGIEALYLSLLMRPETVSPKSSAAASDARAA